MLAVCQICGEVFAEISIEGRTDSIAIAPLRYPLNGTMFGSADPFHGVNPPYALSAAVEWEQFRHYGIHRPMIKDDEILTTKGLVKIPKDGSVAYMDGSKPPEIERDKIADAVLQVSDEDAERMAREILQGGPKVVVSEEVPDNTVWVMDGAMIIEDKEPIPPLYLHEVAVDPDKSAFICAKCNKSFDTLKALQGHMGGAHKPKKKVKK